MIEPTDQGQMMVDDDGTHTYVPLLGDPVDGPPMATGILITAPPTDTPLPTDD